jgi:hypothetical protein
VNYPSDLSANLDKLISNAKFAIGIEAVKDLFTTEVATYLGLAFLPKSPASIINTAVGVITDVNQVYGELADNNILLLYAAIQTDVAKQKIAEMEIVQQKIIMGEELTISEIKSAREALREARGRILTANELIGMTVDPAASNLFRNLKQTSMEIVWKMGGAYTSLFSAGLEQFDPSSDERNADFIKLISEGTDTPVLSPFDEDFVEDYQQIALQRGYTIESNPVTSLFYGTTPPNLEGQIYFPDNYDSSTQTYTFSMSVDPNLIYSIDPEVAIGFEYVVEEGPSVASVELPEFIGDGLYSLWYYDDVNDEFFNSGEELIGGIPFFFEAEGVDRFQIRGIEVDFGLDPFDHQSFITDLTFVDYGDVTLSQTPLTIDVSESASPVPEPSTFFLLGAGLGGMALCRRKIKK